MEYIRRIIDDELNKRQEAFNAINIIGPKGCGKTRTAKERCNTVIEFQDEEKRDEINTEKKACDTHNEIGKIVRKAIKEAGRNYARGFTNSRKKFKTDRKRK